MRIVLFDPLAGLDDVVEFALIKTIEGHYDMP